MAGVRHFPAQKNLDPRRNVMVTFLMYGKYSAGALQQITPERTAKAMQLVEQSGGKMNAMYATLGQFDLVLVLSLPGIEDAVKVSVGLAKLTGISFCSVPAVNVQEFDKLVGGR
jgi:uncharacterized protein with GYD domain